MARKGPRVEEMRVLQFVMSSMERKLRRGGTLQIELTVLIKALKKKPSTFGEPQEIWYNESVGRRLWR